MAVQQAPHPSQEIISSDGLFIYCSPSRYVDGDDSSATVGSSSRGFAVIAGGK